jgi:hypothetical protein
MTASAIQYSVANPLDFLQAALRHDVFEGLGQRQEVLGCPRISLGAIWVATAQCGPPSEFLQEPGNRWSVKFCREGHEDTGHTFVNPHRNALVPAGTDRQRSSSGFRRKTRMTLIEDLRAFSEKIESVGDSHAGAI